MNNSIASIRSSEQGIRCEVINTGKIDLSKVPISELVAEFEKRKDEIIKNEVENLNRSLKMLEKVGVEILDLNDDYYSLSEFFISDDGKIYVRSRESGN